MITIIFISNISFICYNDFYLVCLFYYFPVTGYAVLIPSTFRRRCICCAVSQHNSVLLLKRHKSRKIFLFSASLAAAQLWLIVVFLYHPQHGLPRVHVWETGCTRISSLWLIVVCFAYHCTTQFPFNGSGFNLIIALSNSSQRCSRRSDMTVVFEGPHCLLCLSDTAFIARVFLLLDGVYRSSCK